MSCGSAPRQRPSSNSEADLAARLTIHRDEEIAQAQVTALRDQLQRESLAYGELRAQAARHEAVARETITRADAATKRERQLLRDLGSAHQRVVELEATIEQLRASAARVDSRPLRRSPAKSKTQPWVYQAEAPTRGCDSEALERISKGRCEVARYSVWYAGPP